MTVETRRAWVQSWYMEDVGDSYEVGATIECTFSPITDSTGEFLTKVLGADIADRVTDEGLSRLFDPWNPLIIAVVRSIEQARWRIHPLAGDSRDPDAPRFYAAPGSVVIEARSSTSHGDALCDPPVHGYLIDLEIATDDRL